MPERGPAIVLIGFMGTGKSCAGMELCRRTGLPVFDTDALVVARTNSSIAEIFEEQGEESFREEETAVLRQIPRSPAVVITGGGTILREENVELMRKLGTIVWLQADEAAIFERIGHREDRPLLRGDDPRRRIATLLAAREPLYRNAAEITIDTTTKTPAEVAEAILAELPEIARRENAEAAWSR